MGTDIIDRDEVGPGFSAFAVTPEPAGLPEMLVPSVATVVTGSSVRKLPALKGKVNLIHASLTNTETVYLGLSGGGWIPLAPDDSVVLEASTLIDIGALEVNATVSAQTVTVLSLG